MNRGKGPKQKQSKSRDSAQQQQQPQRDPKSQGKLSKSEPQGAAARRQFLGRAEGST